MSNIRREFYDAINKANVQKPKKVIKKFSPKEELTLEKQIQNILNESDSAIIDCRVTINNQPLIDYLYERFFIFFNYRRSIKLNDSV
jgi:hypothetical protein